MPAIASKPYKAGDVIFEFKPLIHCIKTELRGKYCDNCLKKRSSLKKCCKCHQMYYCDKDCQQNDWKYHKKECKALQCFPIDPYFCRQSFRFMLRLFVCVMDPNFTSKPNQLFDGSDICFNDFGIDARVLTYRSVPQLLAIIGVCCRIFGTKFQKKESYHLIGVILQLSFPLITYDLSPSRIECPPYHDLVGFGITIGLQSFSHSCLPNANLVIDGLSFQIRAMKSIALGEEITIGKVDLAQNKISRHKDLFELNLPICECDRCRLDLDKDIDYNDFDKLFKKYGHFRMNKGPIPLFSTRFNYTIDWQLVIYLREIYGHNSSTAAIILFYCFTCLALHSNNANKSVVKLLYRQMAPILQTAYGSNHSLYNLFQNIYELSLKTLPDYQ